MEVFYYRSHSGEEVDLVLEGPGRRGVGVEVKAWGSLRPEDPRGLKSLAQALGRRFHRGVVLYQGRETVPFAKDLRTTGTVPGAYRVRLKVASLILGGRGRGHGGGPSGGLSPPE